MKYRAYRIELKLNKTQEVMCYKSAGTARYAYNWKLRQLIDSYESNKNVEKEESEKAKRKFGSSIDWHKEWVHLKKELRWIEETSKCCGQEALRDLEKAYGKFFSKKSGYPRFKKRSDRDSFRVTCNVRISNDWIQLPKLGKVKLKEKRRVVLEGILHISQATVKRQADRWFVSFLLKEDVELPKISSI